MNYDNRNIFQENMFNRVRLKYVNGLAQNFYDNQEIVDKFQCLQATSYK